jgi:hypothetical protein
VRVRSINGYVVALGNAAEVPVHRNTTITKRVHQVERGGRVPTPERMTELARVVSQHIREIRGSAT